MNLGVMRISPIAIVALLLVTVVAACGAELTEAATATLGPEPVATVAETPDNTPTPAPTAVVPTATPRPEPTESPAEPPVAATAPERDLDIVTLLPFDAIPAIDNPGFFPDIETANMFYKDGEYILGVEIDGDARAYSVPLLSSHEIVNDVVGGEPIAVTW